MKRALGCVVLLAVSVACTKADESAKADSDTAPVEELAEAGGACAIATDEEMSAAIGEPVTGKQDLGVSHCIYKTNNALAYADITIERENADAAWQGVNAGDSIIGAPQDSLTGIGDKAFFGPRDRLYFRKGTAFVAVEGGFDDNSRSRARNIARLIAGKL